VVYGIDPFGQLDLVLRPLDQRACTDADQRVEEIKKLHEHVRDRIERINSTYSAQANKHQKGKVFQPGDLVWVHLQKDRFPSKRKGKFMPRVEGPFEVVERVNDNVYNIDLPCDCQVSAMFNVSDLSPYEYDENLSNLRSNFATRGG